MIDKRLTLNGIAELLSRAKCSIIRRANNEGWPYRSYAARGGKERRYHLADLPEDIQRAYAESLTISLDELQGALKPASICEKKVVLANYNGRKEGGGELPPLEKADDKKRRTAKLRAKVIHTWDATGWSVEKFVFEYNAGNIAADLKAELGWKSICQ